MKILLQTIQNMFSVTCLIVFCVTFTHASVTDYISPTDERRLFPPLMTAHKELNFSNAYYLAKGLVSLGQGFPKVIALDSCGYLHLSFKNDLSPEEIYYAVSAWNLFKCGSSDILKDLQRKTSNLHTDATVKTLKTALEQEEINTTNIRYALEALTVLGQSIPNPSKIASALETSLKKDESFLSIGHTLHAAALLGNAGKFALSHLEDIVAQADEVDGRMLQWDGGLTTTGLLLTGLLKLPGAKPLTQTQADKFGTYLLTRKTVQHPRGVVTLIDAIDALTKSDISPVSITFVNSPRVTKENPNLGIRVSNIKGQAIKAAASTVTVQSATRVSDDVVMVSKQPLKTTQDPTEFILPLNIEPGQYRISITAGTESATLIARVLGPVNVGTLEVGLGDADGSSAPRLTSLSYPNKLTSVLQADSSQHLIVRFSLKTHVHQPFLRLSSGKREIIFVAELDSNKAYKIDINLGTELTYSAVFDMELILGDSLMSNPLRWSFGSVDVKLTSTEPKQPIVRGPRPEIKHMFRPAEKLPPQVVSMLFTALAAAPLLLLLLLWLKLGINVGNLSVASLPFHIGLTGIFGLFTLFWLQLDMFVTCGWLLPLGGFTFLTGHHVLSKLAKQKKV